jgi:hypothetical protein
MGGGRIPFWFDTLRVPWYSKISRWRLDIVSMHVHILDFLSPLGTLLCHCEEQSDEAISVLATSRSVYSG